MCHPLAIAAGAVQAVGGTMTAMAQHRAAKAAAQRQNMINELTYKDQMNQAKAADQMKAQQYNRELAAHAAAQSAVFQQREINQLERTRVSIAAQQALEEKTTEAAFQAEEKMISQIQAQGTVLASGQQSGQSMLLALMDTERQLGRQEAQINASLRDANKQYRISEYGFGLDQFAADQKSMGMIPGTPVAQMASFEPIKKPKVQGPSGLGLMGGIISSVGGGIGTGFSTYGVGAKNLGWTNMFAKK